MLIFKSSLGYTAQQVVEDEKGKRVISAYGSTHAKAIRALECELRYVKPIRKNKVF